MVLKNGVVGGLRLVFRSWGLVLVLLVVNLAAASLLTVPLFDLIRADLKDRDAASTMMYGFDHAWWSRWSGSQKGFTASFGPEIFGSGFALKNWDLALHGELPAPIFPSPSSDEEAEGLGGLIVGVGLLYLLLQTFLAGGILAVYRAPQGSWTVRGVLHGSGFYFGRFFRIALIALLADGLLFTFNRPLAEFVQRRAMEATSERTALAAVFLRQAFLVLLLLFVNMVSCYAKVITVLEERTSAVLAFLSALAFCFRHVFRTVGHYALILLLGFLALFLWSSLDSSLAVTGYKTQLVALLLGEALIASRLALRLGLLGGQMEIYRRSTAPAP
jgi:hypothetical protein